MLQTKVVEKIKTQILFKWRRLSDNVQRYGSAGQVTDDNMALSHCMLDTYGYRHTLKNM